MCWPGCAWNGERSIVGKWLAGGGEEQGEEEDDEVVESDDNELDRARLHTFDEPANESIWFTDTLVVVGHSMRSVRRVLVMLKHWMSLSEIGVSRTSKVWKLQKAANSKHQKLLCVQSLTHMQLLETESRGNASIWHAVHQRTTAAQTKQTQIGQLRQHNQLMGLEPGAMLQTQFRQMGKVCVDSIQERTGNWHGFAVAQHQAGQSWRKVSDGILYEVTNN